MADCIWESRYALTAILLVTLFSVSSPSQSQQSSIQHNDGYKPPYQDDASKRIKWLGPNDWDTLRDRARKYSIGANRR